MIQKDAKYKRNTLTIASRHLKFESNSKLYGIFTWNHNHIPCHTCLGTEKGFVNISDLQEVSKFAPNSTTDCNRVFGLRLNRHPAETC